MAKSSRLGPVVGLCVGWAIVGCSGPDRGGPDRVADKTAAQPTTETRNAALTASLFDPYVAYATGSRPQAVAIGDLDGDGRNDIAVLTSTKPDPGNDLMVHVFLQSPDGTLQPRVMYPVARAGSSIDIGDINGDGRADVVVGDDSSSGAAIGVLFQNTTGTLDAMVSYATANAYRVKIADFNGDGRADVASLGWGGTGLDVFLQTDTGALAPPVSYAAPHDGQAELDAGDVNGDGLVDVVISCGGTGHPNLSVMLQLPDGTLGAATSYSTGSLWSTNGVAVGDTNGDGRSDIVVSYGGNRPDSFIARYLQNAQGALDAPVPYASYDGPSAIVLADIDGDARKDVLVKHDGFGRLGVYRQYPSADFIREDIYAIPGGSSPLGRPQALAVGDISGDGRPDAVIADPNNGLVVLRHVQDTSLAMAVTSPVGGPYYTGVPLTIRWSAGDVVALAGFDVSLSLNNGTTYTPIAGCTGLQATTTECTWTPTAPASGARIRVTAQDGAGGAASTESTFDVVTPSINWLGFVSQTQYIGATTTISWFHNLPPAYTVRIELSRDGGATYETLTAATPISTNGVGTVGSYNWTVTGPTTSAARLRITSNGVVPASLTFFQNFTIAPMPTTPVVVRSLVSGVQYTTASLVVDWLPAFAGASTARVEISRDGGSTFQTLAASASNVEGHFVGSISGPGATDARIRITANGAVPATGMSDSFQLVVATVTVTGPAAGTTVYTGTSATITWTSNLPTASPVLIHLSRDGGSTFSELGMSMTNTGSYTWNVTGPATSAARIRVMIGGAAPTIGTGDTFSIAVPSVTVIGPAAGATLYAGTPQLVIWSSTLPASSTANIQLSRDGGATYQVLVPNAQNTGNFAFLVAGPSTAAALVRVTVTGPASASGTSGTFAIIEPSLTVTGPAAGAALYGGTTAAITWSTNLPAASVGIQLSRDGGSTFEVLATAAPNTGSFAWFVTGPDAAAAVVRVTATDPVAVSATSGAFSIATPSLTVTGPSAGTVAYAGTPVTITWTHNLPAGDPVSIELSRDDGATFQVLNAAASNTGSFVWTASGPDTTAARVRVTSSGTVSASNVGPAFQIVTATMAVTSPAAGENWVVGTSHTISWSSNLPAGTTALVELSRDNGSSWTTLASAASGGSLAWTATAPATSTALVRVTANGGVSASATSGAFIIGDPSLTVTSPAAGAKWTIGTAQTITWSTNLPPTATVKIELSRNGGSTYTTLASAAPNSGSFAWTATGATSTTAKVRVSANGFSASSVSGTFSLVAAKVTVTSPNTAVTWTVGTVHTITWTHNVGASAQFKIEVSRSGVWSTITSAVTGGGATTGSYQWTVAAPRTSTAKIRVTWTGNTTVTDSSDVSFRIN